jgi:hypothetical protein
LIGPDISLFEYINPFLTFGAGYMHCRNISAERVDGRVRSYDNINFWIVQCGAVVRCYVNPMLDVNVGTELNLTQTYFLDAIPVDFRYDHFMVTYLGVSYKIGAKQKRDHLDWNTVYITRKGRENLRIHINRLRSRSNPRMFR